MRQVANEMAAKKNSGSVMADNTMMKHKLSKQVGCWKAVSALLTVPSCLTLPVVMCHTEAHNCLPPACEDDRCRRGAQLGPCSCIGMSLHICSGPLHRYLDLQPCAALWCDGDCQKILHRQTAEGTSPSCTTDSVCAEFH